MNRAWSGDLTRDDSRHWSRDVIEGDMACGDLSVRDQLERGPIKHEQRFSASSSLWKRLGLLLFLTVSGGVVFVFVTGVLSGAGSDRVSAAEVYHQPPLDATDGGGGGDSLQLKCITTVTSPAVDVCVYSGEDDTPVSQELIETGNWQPTVTKLFLRAMKHYPSCDVLDLGAHVGFYTMLAAQTHHRVLAVEPVLSSLRRIHHAALLSGLRRNLTLFHHAIYNERTIAWLRQPLGNIGGTTVVISDNHKTEGVESVKTILMNDLFPYIQRRIVIIKMDIGGFECRAITSATQLFSGAHIPYIFMAWRTMYRHRNAKNSVCAESNIERITIFLAHRGYVPYDTASSEQLNWRHSSIWNCSHITWRHVSAHDLRDPPAPSTQHPHAATTEEEIGDYAYSLR